MHKNILLQQKKKSEEFEGAHLKTLHILLAQRDKSIACLRNNNALKRFVKNQYTR